MAQNYINSQLEKISLTGIFLYFIYLCQTSKSHAERD